jgi:valyl-tRNA synthetase
MSTLDKSYEPATFESKRYAQWNSHGCFEAADTNAPGQESFCIVIPPPNVTGVLHMGHALTNTIQDILVRWHRMRGDNTLWLPGTDHAGIATQAQVEKQIAKEGKGPSGRPLTRHDLGREKFLERTWKWKEDHAGEITHQLKRLGSSLDWKRERFTMDEGLSKAVREVFVRLYEEKLIYRGERIINWCPRCQTALSDLEVIPTDRKGSLWHLVYKVEGEATELVIATTRPETLLGDTAVAVHPEDERYTHLHGKKAILPLLGRALPIITDEYVDRAFGSGALKLTPAHDFNDNELGKKHGLPMISVMGKDGRITAEGGPYAGLKYMAAAGQTSEAREKIVADLKEQGLLAKVEDHANKVGLCQRCESVAEPIVSKQWFVSIAPLAKPAIEAVETGKITFTPKTWDKTYFEWMYNIRDWCISRQLWWGHRIPAWYCAKCEDVTVARAAPGKCGSCGASDLVQDEDVLDTWFSSALWPFSTLGWPDKTPALKTFYPTSILETGFDIIFFWVARMIMMGLHFMDDVPFQKIYLHAMVRDEKGEKMSKSKGNVIDPLLLIDQHGADPLRFTLAVMAGQGRDIKLSVDRVEGYRAFCNKIWNATKFLHLQFENATVAGRKIAAPAGGCEAWLKEHKRELSAQNAWILSRLQNLHRVVEKGLVDFQLNESSQALYDFAWGELCDWFIEFSKLPLRESGPAQLQSLYTLHYALERLFLLMHPFMPFVTEELWQSLPWRQSRPVAETKGLETLMLQAFPQAVAEFDDVEAEKTVRRLRTVVEAIRNFRGENSLSPRTEFAVEYVPAAGSPAEAFMESYGDDIKQLARVTSFAKHAGAEGMWTEIVIADPGMRLFINLKGLVNVEEESKRLKKEIEKVTVDIDFIANKLGKDTFIAKAPPELVAKEKARQLELIQKRGEIESALARLNKLA